MVSPAPSHRIRLLGGDVTPLTPAQMLAATEGFLARGGAAVIANHNTHSLFLIRRSEPLRRFFAEADLVQVDSRPMIAWGRLLGLPLRPEHRSTYLDWREDFWALARDRSWRILHVGGEPGVGERAKAVLEARFPGLNLKVRHGFFALDGADGEALLAEAAAFDPDIILAGMGMPRQEAWIAMARQRLGRGVFFPVGAALDYEAGEQAAAPRWTGKIGLEWLFRLLSQPRRLAYRYLIEPWFLLPAAVADIGAAMKRRAV